MNADRRWKSLRCCADRVGVSRLLLPVREAAASRVLSQMDTVATNGGRVAALPRPGPWSFAAASAGRLARRNRTVWERRSRPSDDHDRALVGHRADARQVAREPGP